MDRKEKNEAAEAGALIGFILMPVGAAAYSLMDLPVFLGAGLIFLGIALFVAGVEIAVKTEKSKDSE